MIELKYELIAYNEVGEIERLGNFHTYNKAYKAFKDSGFSFGAIYDSESYIIMCLNNWQNKQERNEQFTQEY